MSVNLGQDDDQTIDLYICVILRDWDYSIYIDNVKAMFDDMGKHFIIEMEDIGADAMATIVRNLATWSVISIVVIVCIVSQRDSSNDAMDYMYLLLPCQMVKIEDRELSVIFRIHEERLSASCIFQHISQIEKVFQYLWDAYKHEAPLKLVLCEYNITTMFAQGWGYSR